MPSAPRPHTTFDCATSSGSIAWQLNGDQETTEEDGDALHETCSGPQWFEGQCPYCAVPLERADFSDGDLSQADGEWELERHYGLQSCSNCAYWSFRSREFTNRCMDEPLSVLASSVARKFDACPPPGCSAELAQQLRQRPNYWHDLDPRAMERFVADVFRANYEPCEVVHVGRPGDLGIDILFIDSGKQDWLIQVKRRERAGRSEGFETLQRLLGTLALEGKTHGMIVTNADCFSYQLRRQTKRAADRGFVIGLVDKGKLDRMLSPLLPDRPWLELMKHSMFWRLDEAVRDHFLQRISSASEPSLFDFPRTNP